MCWPVSDGSIGARAIGEFGIDVSTMPWDMTSMSLHGASPTDDQDEHHPQVKHGHPKDRTATIEATRTVFRRLLREGRKPHARRRPLLLASAS